MICEETKVSLFIFNPDCKIIVILFTSPNTSIIGLYIIVILIDCNTIESFVFPTLKINKSLFKRSHVQPRDEPQNQRFNTKVN